MGGSSWSNDAYSRNVSLNVDSHGTPFVHDANIRSGKATAATHNLLDPKGLKIRESRDSDAHPRSNAILVGLDVTGSMGSVIKAIHEKLPTLMGLLLRKNYIPDPQILFAAIGDANTDTAPLQVGQFESGVEMEGDLSRFYIEGNGGGQKTESYELTAYVGARKTAIDCLEKRGKRGYCFLIGDEMPYGEVNRGEVQELIGDRLEASIPTEKIFRELQEKYFTFFIIPQGASHGSDKQVKKRWQDILGAEHVLVLEDPSSVAELIATQIGLCEEATSLDGAMEDLAEHGSKALVPVIKAAVSKAYGTAGVVTKVTPGTIPPSDAPDNVKRL